MRIVTRAVAGLNRCPPGTAGKFLKTCFNGAASYNVG